MKRISILKKRLKVISDELYCKDRKLEELGVPIECCDKDEREKRFKEVYGSIWDSKTDTLYFCNYQSDEENMKRIMKKLNSLADDVEHLEVYSGDLEADLKRLEKENDDYKNDYRELFSNYVALEEENDILKQKLKTKYIINKQYEEKERLKKENEQLQQELQGMNELLKSYRKTIKHDAELLADATRNGYLPPLDDIKR